MFRCQNPQFLRTEIFSSPLTPRFSQQEKPRDHPLPPGDEVSHKLQFVRGYHGREPQYADRR
jgi:hypothetical protein